MKTHTLREEYADVVAFQWFKQGQDKRVGTIAEARKRSADTLWESCPVGCGKSIDEHGICFATKWYTVVCPSDWIVKHEDGTYNVMKDVDFKQKYRSKNNAR